MEDKTRMDQVERRALYCKDHMKEAREELTPFINAQIEMANDFYKRLEKTKRGKEKIRKIRLGK